MARNSSGRSFPKHMATPLKDLAIQHALQNKWEDACNVNQLLLEQNPSDVETLNRLAFALLKLGKYKKAKELYKQVIKLDKTNPIAVKNLKKLDQMGRPSRKSASQAAPSIYLQDLFIEEAGRTKTLELKNITDKKTLSLLQPGDEVSLVIKRSKIFIQTLSQKYVGMLPEDLGTRLINFIKGGNKYTAHLKAINDKNVVIFIKEVKRASRFKYQSSFSSTNSHLLTFD